MVGGCCRVLLGSNPPFSLILLRRIEFKINVKEVTELVYFISSHLKIKVMQEAYPKILNLGFLVDGDRKQLREQ